MLFQQLYPRQLLLWITLLFSSSLFSSTSRLNSAEPFYSYLGGNNNDSAYAIAIDSNNNIFIAGQTNSDSFVEFEKVLSSKSQFNQNCFIIKISSTTADKDFIYEFAGSKRESCREIAIDQYNNIYVTGETQSNDLPVTTDTKFAGGWDSFLLKLSNDGSLLYATYIGGSLTDYGHGLVVKSKDQVYITGETWSTDFPTTLNSYMPDCHLFTSCDGSKANAFLTHIDTSNRFQFVSEYSTYIGGSNQDKAHDLAIDTNGHLHIVGETRSADFPLHRQFQDSLNGTYDGFLVIIDPQGVQSESLTMGSYIGGSGDDFVFSIATDASGKSYIAGETWSDDFLVTENAFSTQCAAGNTKCNPDLIENNFEKNAKHRHSDAFITVISHSPTNLNQTAILYSSLFGGSNQDIAEDILINANNVFISGTTWSNDFPLTDNADKISCNTLNNCDDMSDGFIIKIDLSKTNADNLVYSSYIGGSANDNIFSSAFLSDKIDIGAVNDIYIVGETYSVNMATNDAVDNTIENGEAFLQKLTISSDGNWVRNINNKAETQPKLIMSSAISPFLLLLVLFKLTLLRIRPNSIRLIL